MFKVLYIGFLCFLLSGCINHPMPGGESCTYDTFSSSGVVGEDEKTIEFLNHFGKTYSFIYRGDLRLKKGEVIPVIYTKIKSGACTPMSMKIAPEYYKDKNN